ncbi:MAG: (2Fe-2S)-binding protein [Bdellovibrionales bacterium]|nr:(2Fe-2S)-binding protein [Bdellovibrionales bacterium]
MMKKIEARVVWAGREEASLLLELDYNENITSAQLSGVGDSAFLTLLRSVRPTLKGGLREVPLPEGDSPAALCLREVILRAKGEWDFPYQQEELCHCRAVPTAVVDRAICVGAHTSKKVSEQTSASTACGTCRPDVEAIIAFRLNKNEPKGESK